MDDEMENEVICEIIATHAHLLWRYMAVMGWNMVDIVTPESGETVFSKVYQTGPFMFIIFLVILSSIVLQNSDSVLRQYLYRFKQVVYVPVPVPDKSKLKSILASSASFIDSDRAYEEYKDGIVGIYAMQGRRGNMEDRFSVMQDVPIGENKKVSFFGVYDGHGGQYVAQYVKDNLFLSALDRIKKAMSTSTLKDIGLRNHSVSNGNYLAKQKCGNDVKLEASNVGNAESSCPDKESNRISKTSGHLNSAGDKDDLMVCSSPEKSHSDLISENECQKGEERHRVNGEMGQSESQVRRCSGILPVDFESPLKLDIYSTTKVKRNNSGSSKKDLKACKACGVDDPDDDLIYIDSQNNINYTRLLMDSIISMDKKIVEYCKTNMDMSGTTAIVALLDGELLVIGNVGDSRAVMGDVKGNAIPLSFDHKPNQLKEQKRIREAGGFVTFSGVWRVAGILATSRALGDFPLKDPMKLITAEPDVLTFSLKDHRAQFVILATDGLWDVMSNEDAVAYIRNHLHESDFGARSLSLLAYDLPLSYLHFCVCKLSGLDQET